MSPDVLIFADKTNSIYKTILEQYKKLLKDNITKTYQKSSDLLEKAINMKAKYITKKLDFSNRIEHLPRNHQENFNSKLPCRLINLRKANFGK